MKSTDRSVLYNVENWIKPTLEKNALKNYSITISGSTEKGDGYLGDITFVEVCGRTEENEKKVYNFVIKCGKKGKELREMMPIRAAFENEIFFYNKIFPAFIEFQREKGVQAPFNNAPKCHDTIITEELEVLILENIKHKGFKLHDRRFPMNKEHIKKVMTTYGKLHAISFALKDHKPNVFKNLSDGLKDVFKLRNKKPASDFNVFQHIINLAKEENNQKIIETALLLYDKSKMFNEITDPNDPYAVILHGDCWNNNFMFSYDDEKQLNPSEACLLDFQISRLASPVYDLSYFLFTCLSKEDAKNFDEINGWYYESLSKSLREMGSDPNQMFPFEELMNQWKRFSLFGLFMMPSLIKISLSDADEVPDLEEAAESGNDFATVFSKEVRNIEQYRDRTFAVMELVIEKEFV